ncbi:MAG TPA: hypothetical protein VFJ02_08750 [Vicinamibacterales bacterium]|nr:hypothetical protein [Vicinamibacterales bacterium]
MSYTTLTIVALALLSTTMLLAYVVTKLLRDEKRRSDARVAMLAAMAADAAASAPEEQDPHEFYEDEAADPYEHAVAGAAVFQPESDELPLGYATAAAGAHDMFAARAEQSAWPKRIAVAGALAAVVVAIVLAARGGIFGAAPNATLASQPAQPAPAPAQAQLPLELLSLKQAQQGDTLTITGLVQNPRGSTDLSKIVATAFLFGADGSFLASGRSPLDFTVLRPGDESGFVISVAVKAPVARYRVGFRGEDGHVIGHVDRRSTGTIARGSS